MTVNLRDVADKLGLIQPGGFDKANPIADPYAQFFDLRNVDLSFVGGDLARALTQTIREGGQDDLTRYQGAGKAVGHFIRMVREGRYTAEEAWQATKEWNAATLSPPWSEDRLRGDFERLFSADLREKGPVISAPPLSAPPAGGWSVTDWRADRFAGAAPERRWLIEGLIPAGTPGVFAAVGDAGKSMLALRLALYVTSYPAPTPELDVGSPRFFGQPVVARGAAVVLTAEDDAAEVHRRLNGLDPAYARRGRPLYVVPMISTGGARTILADGFNGPAPTQFWYDLRSQLLGIPDLRLVVIDPVSSFISADMNDNNAMSGLMTVLAELASVTGAAVMLIHHLAKATVPTSLSNARTAIRGAGALVDNSRWALVLWEADEKAANDVLRATGEEKRANQAGVVYFGGLAKGNAPGQKLLRTLVRNSSGGVLEDVTDAVRASTPRAADIDGLVHQALMAERGRDERFAFPISRNSVDRHVMPLLRQAKVNVDLGNAFAAIQRLQGCGLLVRLEGKGDKYEPVAGATG